MSGPPEMPWTEEEKVRVSTSSPLSCCLLTFPPVTAESIKSVGDMLIGGIVTQYALLTEILKKANVSSAHLYNMIREFGISPRWQDIPLPSGRSLNSCQMAFDHMRQQPVAPGQPLPPPIRTEPWVPAGPPPESASRKRPLFPPDRPTLPRAIQPKIGQFPGGEVSSPIHVPPSYEGLAPRQGEPPRKRGRPSKAETERRKAAAEARGESYPPQRRPLAAKQRSPLMGPGVIGASPVGATIGERPPLLPRTAMHAQEMQRQQGLAPDAPIGRNDREMEPQASLPPMTEQRAIKETAPTAPTAPITPPHAGPQLFPRPRESQLVPEESTLRPPEEPIHTPHKAAEAPARAETYPVSHVGTHHPSHDPPPSSTPERVSHMGPGEASIPPLPGSGPAKT